MLNCSMLYPVTTVSRRVVSMDGMWKFILDERSEGEEHGYVGDMWYEKDMFVPGEWEGKDVAYLLKNRWTKLPVDYKD